VAVPHHGIGDIIDGRYRIDAELGMGGTAAVFRVRDLPTGVDLALKQLAADASARVRALFEREYHALSGFRHPRIVEVHDYGSCDGVAYYTMQLLDGCDLGRLAPLPWRDVCAAIRDVASGLSLLHARRMLYRDVNPRNLWRLRDGSIKIIDFGALTAFGTAGEIVGTPPFVAPESLYGGELDQRTDLYGLGALAYYLLTGAHAYAARGLRELPDSWRGAIVPPSRRVAELARADLPALPPELDALLAALLSHTPVQRPASAAELIDRMAAIAGFERDPGELGVNAVLRSAELSGRVRERRSLRRRSRMAELGRGSCVLIEAKSGAGRTRLLRELATEARLEGATVLQIDAALCQGALGVASACALKLLHALPEQALRAAEPFARVLAHLGPEVRARLGQPQLAPVPPLPGELRLRISSALHAWFASVCGARRVLILIDDLAFIDDASAAWLAVVAQEIRQHRLLLAISADSDSLAALGSSAQTLIAAASRLALGPLAFDDVLQLLRSLFGDAPHLRRLAERLYRVAGGNPGHCLELVEHLMQRDAIANVGGTWVLPTELSDSQLPPSGGDGPLRRLERLPPYARAFAQRLAVAQGGALPIELCMALSDSPPAQSYDALDVLVREGVLTGGAQGYRFVHERTRELLAGELEGPRASAAHLRLGSALLSGAGERALPRLEAGVHLLRAGDPRGSEIVASAARRLVLEEFDDLARAVPPLERAVPLLQGPELRWELASVSSALSSAACFCDHRLLRYGDATVSLLEELLGLPLARALGKWVGRKPGLLLGLGWTAFRNLFRAHGPRVLPLREALMLLFTSVGSLAGAHAIFLDAPSIARYATVLEPFAVLGRDHLAALVHELIEGLRLTAEDRAGAAGAHLARLIERLQSARPIRDLPDYLRPRVLGGALFAAGIVQAYRDGSEALRTAEQLERLDIQLYAMGAEEIRSVWHAHQLDAAVSARHRERAELFAIALGAAWQVVAWAPAVLINVSIRTRDALASKHAAEQLQRSSASMPALRLYAVVARGVYLALRGRYAEAAQELEACLAGAPLAFSGWTSATAMLASAYRGLGDPARARALCERALAAQSPPDLCFPAQVSSVQVELARAQSALGEHARAGEELDALIERHTPERGPLTLGMLHQVRAEVALAAGDLALYQFHFARMKLWYLPSGIPSLIQQCDQLAQAGAPRTEAAATESHARYSDPEAETVVESIALLRSGR
jgi:tetratricopeptide (TPR) repeat protein